MQSTMINVFICSSTLVECYQLVKLICCLFLDVSCLMEETKSVSYSLKAILQVYELMIEILSK